jgi:hypothetical protein
MLRCFGARYQMQIKCARDYRAAHFIKIYCSARDEEKAPRGRKRSN